jgi:hypothetical protein
MASLVDTVSDYNYLVKEYFDVKDHFSSYSSPSLAKPKEKTAIFKKDSYTLTVIQNLIKAFDAYCIKVMNFEKNNGRNEHEYIEISQKDGSKKTPEERRKEWRRMAKQQKYQEAKAAIAFLKRYVELLEDAVRNGKKVEVSYAIDRIATMSTGSATVDSDNKRLCALYYKKLKEDIEELTSKQRKATNDDIAHIRKKDNFYHWKTKTGNLLLPTVYKDLGFNSSCGITFKNIFDTLRIETKNVDIDVQPYDIKKNSDLIWGPYHERVKKIEQEIEKLETCKASLKEYSKYEDYLSSDKDRESLKEVTYNALSQIDSLRKLYNIFAKSKNKKEKVMIKYEALNQRLAAIEETLTVIEANELPKTYQLLKEEKTKCMNEIKKIQSVVRDIEMILTTIESEIIKMNDLMITYNGYVGKANDEELERQSASVDEHEQFMMWTGLRHGKGNGLHDAPWKPIINQAEIDKIKEEVLSEMSFEGYKPRASLQNDLEHIKDNYDKGFNDEFRRRLISKLEKLGIEYEGADLSNPRDTAPVEEAHKASRM